MKKSVVALFAVIITLLWIGAVHARPPLTCAQRQTSSVESLLSLVNFGEQLCTASLKARGCDASACDVRQALPATGQTTSYEAADDGAVKAGGALSYTDNGDGTVTDNNTKLMWEKKDDDSGDSLHYYGDDNYPWTGTCQDNSTVCGTDADCSLVSGTAKCTAGNGTQYTIFQWVAQLNAVAFAGHTDWRIPNVKELENILDYGTSQPAVVNTAFNNSCTSGCTVTSCSCTSTAFTWSSTTSAGISYDAFGVDFGQGLVFNNGKTNGGSVRAVRGGL